MPGSAAAAVVATAAAMLAPTNAAADGALSAGPEACCHTVPPTTMYTYLIINFDGAFCFHRCHAEVLCSDRSPACRGCKKKKPSGQYLTGVVPDDVGIVVVVVVLVVVPDAAADTAVVPVSLFFQKKYPRLPLPVQGGSIPLQHGP